MTTARRWAGLAVAAAVLSAGCGSVTGEVAAPVRTPPPPSLATSFVTAEGTWAVAAMSSSAGGRNDFWQLFLRPAGSSAWRLATPPAVASNGGLVAAAGGQSVVAGFRPSQYLASSPLAATSDSGRTWSPGILDATLAHAPDALAAGAGGHLLALLTDGTLQASASATGTPGWSQVTSERAVAASPAGRACDLRALTAVAFSPSGTPLAGGTCARPGTAGIFARAAGTWQAAGPALPRSVAGQAVTTLRLATSGASTTALLAAGAGSAASLLAAWTGDGGAHWALAPPLALGGAQVRSSGFGAGGAAWLIRTDGRAETISGPGGTWQQLPALPAGTAALAIGPAATGPAPAPGQVDALVTHGSTLTDWRLDRGAGSAAPATAWRSVQNINVPIQFGSSG